MFERASALTPAPAAAAPGSSAALPGVLQTAALAGWRRQLAGLDRAVDDAERIEQIRLLEELKSAAAAAQAVVTADFVTSQRAEQKAEGVPGRRPGQGGGRRRSLWRGGSPRTGARAWSGWRRRWCTRCRETMAALQAGQISEWRATIVARETACLTREDRQTADGELAGRLARAG